MPGIAAADTTITLSRLRADLRDTLAGAIRRCHRLSGGGFGAPDGALIREARLMKVDADDALTWAVLEARTRGAGWAQIAGWLNESPEYVAEHYGNVEACYQATGNIRPDVHEV